MRNRLSVIIQNTDYYPCLCLLLITDYLSLVLLRFSFAPRRYGSKAKMRFQSFFMLVTVQPCFFVWSYSAWVKWFHLNVIAQ
jgi:hypothetical protein